MDLINSELNLHIVIRDIKNIWMPDPMTAAKSLGYRGGLKTSPCTSFHPDSSRASSIPSSELYRAMSRRNVRTIIIVNIPMS